MFTVELACQQQFMDTEKQQEKNTAQRLKKTFLENVF